MSCFLLSAGKAVERVLHLRQRKDRFQQLIHFLLGQSLEHRGKALHRTADVAKLMGAFRPFAFFVILLAVFQTGKPALLLCKPDFRLFFLLPELVECFLF